MADLGEQYTDKKVEQVSKRLNSIYKDAARELQEKEDEFWAGHARRDAMYRAKVKAGKMSQEDYEAWLKGQVFQGKQWAAKRDAIARTMVKADQAAYDIINSGKSDVFAYNANYAGYEIEHGLGANIGFGLYNREAVARIVRDDPDLLPAIDPKKLNPEKDARWYQRVVSNSVTQGIIQGEGIDAIRRRIEKTCADRGRTAAQRDARTAYTGAQNAGRIGAMHQAEDLGLEVKKRWLATLDDKTRDTHRDLDGQEVVPDEPFVTPDGDEIMYPGDPHAEPALVYNCRCRVITVYPKYQHMRHDVRRDNETGEDVGAMTYREWYTKKLALSDNAFDYKSYKSEADFDAVISEIRGRREYLFDADEYDKAETDELLERLLKIQDMKELWVESRTLAQNDFGVQRLLLSNNPTNVMRGVEKAINGKRFGLPDSVWNGNAVIKPLSEMERVFGRVSEPDGLVSFREGVLHDYSVVIHEDLHLRSIWRYPDRADRQYVRNNIRGYEEGVVQLMTEAICERAGISVTKTYKPYTEALQTLHHILEPGRSDYSFSKNLFDMSPMARYNYIDARVDELRRNTSEWESIKGIVEPALETLRRTEI